MAQKIPFDFVLEQLSAKKPLTKPMFGSTGVYVDGKIVFILRQREKYPQDNGLWLATVAEHHESLKKDFPSMRSIGLFGPGPSGWQNLPVSSQDFESSVGRAVELVLRGDPRIGKVPGKKITRSKKTFKLKKTSGTKEKKVESSKRRSIKKKSTQKSLASSRKK